MTKIKSVISYIFAEDEDFSLENRMFLSAIIIGTLTSLVGSVINLVLSTSLPAVIIPLLLSAMMIVVYFLVRFKRIVEPFKIPLIVTALIGISVIWVFNGGINGSNIMPGFVILILGLIVFPDKKKKYVVILFIALNVVIYLIQLYRPDLIVNYTSQTERWIDSLFTLIYSSYFIFLIVKYFHKQYTFERINSAENEKKYRELVENSPDAILIYVSGKIVYSNKECLRLIAAGSEKELIGKSVIQFVHPDSREMVRSRMVTVADERAIVHLTEEKLLRIDGSEVDVEIKAMPIILANKSAVQLIIREITARKEAEKALHNERLLLRTLIDNIPDSVYSKDLFCRKTLANEADVIYSGAKSEAELLGKDDFAFYPKEMAEKFIADDLFVIKTGEAMLNREEFVFDENGQIRYLLSSKLPLRDKEGQLIGLVGIGRDITARKLSEIALQESEALYRNLVEKLPDGIYKSTHEGKFVEVNQAMVEILGYDSKEELLGIDIITQLYFDPVDRESVILKDKLKKTGVYRMRKKDGSEIWIEDHGWFNHDEKLDILFHEGIMRDITERKRSEMALQESESLYRNLVEKMPDGVYKSTHAGKFVDVNPAMVKMLGYANKEELLAIDIKTQLYFKSSDRESLVLQEKLEEMGIYPLKKKDGSAIWVEDHGWYNADEKGNIIFHEGILRDITERKLADEILRASDEQHRAILQTAMDGFWILDIEGRILEVNETYCRMSGYSMQELLTMHVTGVVAGESADVTDLQIQKAMEQGESRFESRHCRKDGSIYEVEVSVKYQPYKGGRLVAFLHDITERKKAEIALQKSEKLFQTLAEASPVGIFKTTNDGYTTYVNPRWSELAGLSFTNALGDGWLIAVHPDDKNELNDGWKIATKNLSSSYSEYRFVHPDGKIVWVIGQAIPELNAENQIIGYIGTITDITERKQAIKALTESEEKLRTVFTTMEEGLALNEFIYNEQGSIVDYRILEVNPAFERILGLQRDQVTGKLASEVYQISRHHITDFWKVQMDGIRPVNTEEYDENLKTWKIVSTSNPMGNKFVTLFFDITDRKKMEIELVVSKEKAEESDMLKSAFLANMSHEIRTPMNGILGFAELLKTPDLTGAEQMEYIRIIKKSGDRMLNIINDIVDISKIESGQTEVFISETKVNEQTEFLYSFFRPEVEKKGITLISRNGLTDNEAIINTDKEKLYAVLTNLIKNAIKFTSNGSIEFGYTLKQALPSSDSGIMQLSGSEAANDELEFFVKDTGFGIPANRQQAIFDRFVQADIADSRAFQGAGLGLSISKAYIEMMGGKIWVESQEGKGSDFYFTVPFKTGTKAVSMAKNETLVVQHEAHDKKLKVLITEDDETSFFYLLVALRDISYEILKARTGGEAVETCRMNPDIDLVLMDIKMPEMDGYEATRQIREFNTEVIIIAQTAFGLTGDREKALQAGCDEYIPKPLNRIELMTIINSFFKHRIDITPGI